MTKSKEINIVQRLAVATVHQISFSEQFRKVAKKFKLLMTLSNNNCCVNREIIIEKYIDVFYDVDMKFPYACLQTDGLTPR